LPADKDAKPSAKTRHTYPTRGTSTQKKNHQIDHTLITGHNTQHQTESLQQVEEHQEPKCQYQPIHNQRNPSRLAIISHSQIDLRTPPTPSKRNPRPHTSIQPCQIREPDETCTKHTTTTNYGQLRLLNNAQNQSFKYFIQQ